MRSHWFAAVLAPALVAVGLLVLHEVWYVFLAYHLALCLGLPVLTARREGLDAPNLARRLGLGRGGLGVGVLLGAAALALPALAHLLMPAAFPDAAQLQAAMGKWGVAPGEVTPVLVFLAVVNGPAEEIFWRGHLQDRLLRGLPSAGMLVLLFTSYHVLTVGALAPDAGGMALMLAGVAGGAVFWTWSRSRWRSLWPALLTHAGATVGYVLVAGRTLAG